MPPLLELLQIGFTAGGEQRYDGLTQRLARGEVLEVRGPSGSGKSTLLRIIARLRGADGGELRLSGRPAREIAPRRWRRQIAYLPQRPVMLPGTVRENVFAGFACRSAPAALAPARGVELLERLKLPVRTWDRPAMLLSGGEAALLACARALLLDPLVLLADELTAALDRRRAVVLTDLLQERLAAGLALVLVAHDRAPWAPIAERAAVLDLTPAPRSEP